MTDGVWWFFLFWLPAFLKDQYGITGTAVMLPLVALYSMTMFGSIGGGYFPMYFIKKGYHPYDGRMKAMLLIAIIPLVVLAAQPLGHISYWMPVLLIGIGASAHQAWSANIFTTVSDMFPKKAIASVVGIGGMAGGIGGVIITKVGGALFDHYKKLGHIETGYTIMFAFCAVAYLIAWSEMKSLVPKYKRSNYYLSYSPQILSFPSSHCFTKSVVTDFGLSNGKASALSQHRLASTPSARLTANKTV